MKKFTSLVFLACVLLFLIAVSAASSVEEESAHLNKRNNICPQQYKRNILGKRNYVKKCPCALARAVFDDGKVEGIVIYAQDACGSTTVTGFFSKGFDDPKGNFTFKVVDSCGKVLQDLGNLGAVFANGEAKPFAQKFDFNLNCDKSGILLAKPGLTKRNNYDYCPTYYKRQGGGSYMEVEDNGNSYSSASIDSLG